MVCPVDADGGATRMSETGRPSPGLPPSGAPTAAASASGTGSRVRHEAGVLPIRDTRSTGVPETAIINPPPPPPPPKYCSKNRELRRSSNPGTLRTPDNPLGHRPESSPPGRRPTLDRRYGKLLPHTATARAAVPRLPSPHPTRVRSGGALSHAKRFDPVRRRLRAPSATSRFDPPAAQGRGGTAFPIRAGLPGEERSVPSSECAFRALPLLRPLRAASTLRQRKAAAGRRSRFEPGFPERNAPFRVPSAHSEPCPAHPAHG